MMKPTPVETVERFWELMGTNDFRAVGALLGDEFVLDWPQSNERIIGRDNYATMNEEYPAEGPWEFAINRVVGNDLEAVSDVSLTDGVHRARAISFFTVIEGVIVRMVEYWPENFPAPDNRQHLVEKIEL